MRKFIRHSGSTIQYNKLTIQNNVIKQREIKEKMNLVHYSFNI